MKSVSLSENFQTKLKKLETKFKYQRRHVAPSATTTQDVSAPSINEVPASCQRSASNALRAPLALP